MKFCGGLGELPRNELHQQCGASICSYLICTHHAKLEQIRNKHEIKNYNLIHIKKNIPMPFYTCLHIGPNGKPIG